MKKLNILIGGDLVPTTSNFELFNSANIVELLGGDLLDVLKHADFRIFNLEVPLADREEPIRKCGPNLIAPTSTINAIKQIPANLLTLANNHILDQGEQGLYSTIRVLEEKDIDYVGAGANLDEAAQPYIWENEGIRVGVYACAEHEFTIATKNSPGANPFEPLESLDHIQDLANKCNYLIVLYHGGKEHYRYPSPNLQKVGRKMVDKGADLVVCQHSHCVGAFENYNGSTIVYGQGNFLFADSESEFWQTALLLDVELTDKSMSVDYIPIVKNGNSVRLADQHNYEKILQEFQERSRQILDEGFIQESYNEFAAQMLNNYLAAFLGKSFTIRVLNRLSGNKLAAKLHSEESLLRLRNYLKCEAHRELVLAGLKKKDSN